MKALLVTALVLAGSGSLKKAKPAAADFSMPDLPALPTGNDLQKAADKGPKVQTRAPADPRHATYALVSVQNAQQFTLQGDHYEARFVIPKVEVVNLPMTVASFHTLVRVKSAEHLGASIGVRLLDPTGHQVLSSQGALVFGGHDETEFLVDWDPFTLTRGGTYSFEVSVAGQVIGSEPFPVSQELQAKLVATQVDAGAPDAGTPNPNAGSIENMPY